jgi:phosphatidylethanolamine-binding protein (PEBP) family uncharacterized protein
MFVARLRARVGVHLLTAVLVVQLFIVTQTGSAAMPLTLTSPAFANGADIPKRYTCEGAAVSPPLAW